MPADMNVAVNHDALSVIDVSHLVEAGLSCTIVDVQASITKVCVVPDVNASIDGMDQPG